MMTSTIRRGSSGEAPIFKKKECEPVKLPESGEGRDGEKWRKN